MTLNIKMAKNKVKPHGDANTTENYNKKKTNNHLFKSQNANNNNNNNQQKYTNNKHSKFKNGAKIEKKYKNNKQQFGAKIRNNKVDDIENTNTSTFNQNKKVFDKKTWRLKKYSKKYKLQQWEEKRKKALLTEYYKQLKNEDDTNKFDVNKIYEEYFDSDEERQTNPKVNYVTNPNFKVISNSGSDQDRCKSKENVNSEETKNNNEIKSPKKKLSAYHRAQLEYQRLQDEKKQKKEDMLRQKAEREEALKKYKKNKMEKYKKLSKKTRKGQPIMADRMEMLLEKIQSTSV